MSLSKSKVDKLGDRLRKAAEPADADLALLQEYIAEHQEAEQSVVERLRRGVRVHHGPALAGRLIDERGWGSAASPMQQAISLLKHREPEGPVPLQPTSRVKTLDTTLEKLRRERTRLSTIQDIAGVRVVIDGGRVQQDAVVIGLLEVYPGAEVKDRRATPSSGYRAVHLIVEVNGKKVEIQIRTKLQDLWAQVFERLADHVGRQIRYGKPPTDPAVPLDVGAAITRERYVELVIELSDLVAGFEQMTPHGEVLEAMAQVVAPILEQAGSGAAGADLVDRADALEQGLRKEQAASAEFDEKLRALEAEFEGALEEMVRQWSIPPNEVGSQP